MRAAADALAADGYEREGDGPDSAVVVRWADDHPVFVKLHLRGDEKVHNQLLFREHLREHPDARREYERAKRAAVAEPPEDHEAYTRAKSDVVSSLLERAREGGYADGLPDSV